MFIWMLYGVRDCLLKQTLYVGVSEAAVCSQTIVSLFDLNTWPKGSYTISPVTTNNGGMYRELWIIEVARDSIGLLSYNDTPCSLA